MKRGLIHCVHRQESSHTTFHSTIENLKNKRMKTWHTGCLALLLLGFSVACNSGTGHQQAENDTDSTLVEMHVEVSTATAAKMDSLLQAYYQLKDALVEGDSAAVPAIAGRLLERTSGLAAEGMTAADKKAAVQSQLTTITAELQALQQPEGLAAIRAGFAKISAATYQLVKTVGLKEVTVYRTYCPMAFDNQGAYWLSDAATIRNPYFGHQMINCGWVKETLQF